jgi:hypothetical protein
MIDRFSSQKGLVPSQYLWTKCSLQSEVHSSAKFISVQVSSWHTRSDKRKSSFCRAASLDNLTHLIFIPLRTSVAFRVLYSSRPNPLPFLQSWYVRNTAGMITTCSNDKSVEFLNSFSHAAIKGLGAQHTHTLLSFCIYQGHQYSV